MVSVELGRDGCWYLVTRKGVFKKKAKLKEESRSRFFVSCNFQSSFSSGERKIYKYARVTIGEMNIKVPDELLGKHVRFKLEYQDDLGVWQNARE